MALANYSDLQSAVAGWLNRTDLTSQIPDFIALAESKLDSHPDGVELRAVAFQHATIKTQEVNKK